MIGFTRGSHFFIIIAVSLPCALAWEGFVQDPQGKPVADAQVLVYTPSGSLAGSAVTAVDGTFRLDPAPAGAVVLEVRGNGMEATLSLRPGDRRPVIVLKPAPIRTLMTVTAERGLPVSAADAAQVVSVVDLRTVRLRPLTNVGKALEPAPGILLQQTGPSQVSPFLRGLTGYQVLNLIDGVRFNNSTFRSGPNQYLAFVDPSQAQRVEAVLGPAGAQYGSDAMGGAIQVLTPQTIFGAGRAEWHGNLRGNAGFADALGGGAAEAQRVTERTAWLAGVSYRRHGNLRPGNGMDSRHVFTRLFGLDAGQVRSLLGGRLRETGFSQEALYSKLALRLPDRNLMTLWYQRAEQRGAENYKDLDGGLGRLQSGLVPQRLDFAYARWEKLALGPLDSLNATLSWNRQGDGTVRQGLRLTDTVTTDRSRVDVWGASLQAATHVARSQAIVFGGEFYREAIDASRTEFSPTSGFGPPVRPLYPNGSRYGTAAVYGQDTAELWRGRLRAMAGVRGTFVGFDTFARKNIVAGRDLGVADSSQTFRDATFQSSLAARVHSRLSLFWAVGRGFRAPNVNDLGAVGLNDLGYEVPSADAAAAGALLATSAGEGALSQGSRLRPLGPERLWNYEAGLKVHGSGFYARAQFFRAELYDPVVRRTLLFPAGAAPAQLGALAVVPLPQTEAQRAQGVVTVAAPFDPRAVKSFVNDGRARYEGVESLLEWQVASGWSARAGYSFIAGRDLNPNRNIRRLPPQQGYAAVRRARGRWWAEASLLAAGAQERLSGGDLDDERIGASRRRRDIADFFAGGRAAPWIAPGADGSRFVPTGETLLEIQNRVLPLGQVRNGVRIVDDSTRVPLFLSTAAWTRVDLQGGVSLRDDLDLQFGALNLLDRNYRLHGSGIDAQGFNLYLGFSWRF